MGSAKISGDGCEFERPVLTSGCGYLEVSGCELFLLSTSDFEQ